MQRRKVDVQTVLSWYGQELKWSRHEPEDELDQVAGEEARQTGKPKLVVRVCWESLAEDPVKMIFNSHLRRSFNHILEVAGDNLSGPCSKLQLSRWPPEAVVARSLVLVVAVTPAPAGGHQR